MISIGLAAKAVWSGLKKIPWQVYACAGVLFGCWLYGNYRAGLVQAEWDASIARGTAIVEELKKGQNKVTVKVEEKVVERIQTIYKTGATIEKEIPVFIPSPFERLPAGFRLLHDAAATNTIPDSSQLPFTTAPSIRDVTSTVIRNYESCQVIREIALGWQDWYLQQQELYTQATCETQQGKNCNKGIPEQ